MKAKYVIELQHGCWVADREGDPGRTILPIYAQRFNSRAEAARKLEECKNYRTLKKAQIIEI